MAKISASLASRFKDSLRVVFLTVGSPCSSKSNFSFRGTSVIFLTCILRSLLSSTFPTLDLTSSANFVLQDTNLASPPKGKILSVETHSDKSEGTSPISCANKSSAAALLISLSSSDAGWLKRHDMPTAIPVRDSQSGTNPMSAKRNALKVTQR